MLGALIASSRDEILRRTRAMAAARCPLPSHDDADGARGGGDVSPFLRQLLDRLDDASPSSGDLAASAASHGRDMLREGSTIAQVVQSYGDVCQVVTAIAIERNLDITTKDFKTLNRCLDTATAEAVSEYERQRDRTATEQGAERLGFLAHELRNKLNSAMLAFDALRNGSVGIGGSTGAVLGRSLNGIRYLVDRALMEVRLESGLIAKERMFLWSFAEEIEVTGAFEANQREVRLLVACPDRTVEIEVEHHIFSAAVGNLVQNACKFTPAGGRVTVRAHAEGDRVSIEVEDECGGLPPGAPESLFRPFEQRNRDRSGLGLGLAVSRLGVEANGGTIHARDLPGKGCVFTIVLPVASGGRRP